MIERKGQRLGSLLHDKEDEPGPEPSPEEQATDEPDAPETPDEPETSDEPARPAQTDLKEAWVDYAEHRGLDRDEAESMTKADLIELLKES